MIKQLKYTISEISKILVPLDQTYFPRLRLWKLILSRGTRILLTPSMVYFNCILKHPTNIHSVSLRTFVECRDTVIAPFSSSKTKRQKNRAYHTCHSCISNNFMYTINLFCGYNSDNNTCTSQL